ncbi:hypothetical protein BpHYR1_008302 [Brachionus plicatilis]|uniref:Uncharacterized protein n=1 Tax=Brachionus plicatilis TaxID=10195 RepID=A0A3M7RZA0_BRAPC|nr:hypothetical protein BpHYR1_008302 [Brachionus plicatilis]
MYIENRIHFILFIVFGDFLSPKNVSSRLSAFSVIPCFWSLSRTGMSDLSNCWSVLPFTKMVLFSCPGIPSKILRMHSVNSSEALEMPMWSLL